ncbi:MAG: TonB-dependent receptor [Flavobacteriales bacterium]|nr:TonB-dependent receptor [Flavobacteriales bacterium]
MSLSARAQCDFLSNQIPFSCQSITRAEALDKLARENGFQVNYPTNCLGQDKITIAAKHSAIDQLIAAIIGGHDVFYQCVGEKSLVFQCGQRLTLAGFIRDSVSGTPVPGAVVLYDNQLTETDQDGYFIMRLLHHPVRITVYHPGYDPYVQWIDAQPNGDNLIELHLHPNSNLPQAVVHVFDSIKFVSKTGGVNVNMKEVEKIPSISGSPGILNSLRFIPGLQSTLEVNGGMIVRGGTKDQNLVLLDGMELYNPMHLFGLFSVFGEGSIQGVDFYRGAYPARYGGRLSSVLDVRSRAGDYNKWNSKLNFNPVLFEATINGPLKNKKTSLLLSGRRSFTDFFPLFYEQIQNQNQLSRFKYFFYDMTGTLNHRFSDRTSFYLTSYYGGDKGYIRGKNEVTGSSSINELNNDEFLQSNLLTSMGLKMWLTKTFHVHARVGHTRYTFSHDNAYDLTIDGTEQSYQRITRLAYQSQINDWKTGVYFKSARNPNRIWQFGIENVWHKFTPASSSYFLQENDAVLYDTAFAQRNSDIPEQRYFVQNLWSIRNWRILTGVHGATFNSSTSYHSLQPRVALVYEPKGKNRWEVGYAKTTQFIMSIPNNLLGIPIDVWVPADSTISPQHCQTYSVGYSRKFGKNYLFKLDGYHKQFRNIIEFRSDVVDLVSEWDRALYIGKSRSMGAEFLFKKEKGIFNGWMSYTLSKTERSIDQINDGAWFPFQFDRRHDFNLVLNYQPNPALVIGATWTYASGHYLTAPESQFLVSAEGKRFLIQQYGSKNNLKLPAYHRLDFGVHYHKTTGNAKETWSFTVYNAYNRQNVYYVNSTVNTSGTVTFHPISILPILPSINYAIRF